MSRLLARSQAWVVAAVVIAASCSHPPPTVPRSPSPEAILDEMVATYRSAASYEDHGTVVQNFIGSHARQADFDTVLVRTVGFRYDVRDEWGGSPGVFWTRGDKLLSHRRGGTIEQRTSLGGARFYSAVPGLLLPAHASGPTLADLAHLRLAPTTELIDGHPCWQLTGAPKQGGEMTLWIDQSSHLLRRTVLRRHFEAAVERTAFDVETTTEYRPSLDGPIVATRLQGPDPKTLPAPRPLPWIGVELEVGSLRITRVLAGAPGERAGLQAGDEVVSVAGITVADASAFVSHVERERVGSNVAVVVRRNGQARSIAVTVGDRTDYRERQLALVDKPAPSFSATAVAGPYPASSSRLEGSVVVLDFTPPTFVSCLDCESPEGVFMSKLQDKYGARGLRIVGLSRQDPAELKKIAADLRLTYTLAYDDDSRAANAYLVHGPTTVIVIDRSGVLRFVASRTGIEFLIDQVLAEK